MKGLLTLDRRLMSHVHVHLYTWFRFPESRHRFKYSFVLPPPFEISPCSARQSPPPPGGRLSPSDGLGSLKWIMRVLNSQGSRLWWLHHPSCFTCVLFASINGGYHSIP